MGQINDKTGHADSQGQQGGNVPISPDERKRQSNYLEPERARSENPDAQTEGERKGNATVAELPGGNKSERTGKAERPNSR
jgi:hypothetical protein